MNDEGVSFFFFFWCIVWFENLSTAGSSFKFWNPNFT